MAWTLSVFANLDRIVLKNLSNFAADIPHPEAEMYFATQSHIEAIHMDVYQLLILHLIPEETEKIKLLNAIKTIPAVKKLGDWTEQWMNRDTASFAERAIAFACVEGLFFSGAFASIFWMQHVKKLLPAVTSTNKLISRDERLHTEAYITCYHLLQPANKLTDKRVLEIVLSAYEQIHDFTLSSLPEDLEAMDKSIMSQYMQYIVDRLLSMMIGKTHFNVDYPFDFMDSITYPEMSNFFERLETGYSRAGYTKTMKSERLQEVSDDDF